MTSQFLKLASSTFFPQIFLSDGNLFRRPLPRSFLSTLVTASVHLSFAFQTGRLPFIFPSKIFLDILYPSILQTCPTRSNLPSLLSVCVTTSMAVT